MDSAHALPAGRTADGAAVSQFGKLARVARDAEREQGDVMKPCAGVVRKGRGRLTPPMYDVGCTMYDLEIRARCAGFGRASADGI